MTMDWPVFGFSFKQVKFGKFLTKLQNLENEKKIQFQF